MILYKQSLRQPACFLGSAATQDGGPYCRKPGRIRLRGIRACRAAGADERVRGGRMGLRTVCHSVSYMARRQAAFSSNISSSKAAAKGRTNTASKYSQLGQECCRNEKPTLERFGRRFCGNRVVAFESAGAPGPARRVRCSPGLYCSLGNLLATARPLNVRTPWISRLAVPKHADVGVFEISRMAVAK
jgi:hypothetical protein